MLEAVERIARAVSVPVTADVEAGYGDPLATARAVVESGAVGINLEDGHAPLHKHAAHIREIREATDLVINARTDVFLLGIGEPATRLIGLWSDERLPSRGADCAFAPGIGDVETIEKLACRGTRPFEYPGKRGYAAYC